VRHVPTSRFRALVLAVTIGLASGCTQATHDASPEPAAAPAVKRYSAQEAAELVAKGEAILVDVRERDEIAPGIAEPAFWMPLSGDGGYSWKELRDTLGTGRTALFYCRSGRRSGNMAKQLAAEGFKTGNAGGYSEWVSAGLPTRQPSPARDRY